jgi:L-2-amino-thiazoline-4-carboxylic acid hydrolase
MNRFHAGVCQRVLAAELGAAAAARICTEAGVADLPTVLPAGPRDFDALARELQPFVDLYRSLLGHTSREAALALIRACIIDSGSVSHSAEASASEAAHTPQPLTLTSPPPAGFSMPDDEMQAGFDLAMRFFSCEGELLNYTPEHVRFHVTQCNWCEAMRAAQAPELIPFFCETDERFMDAHPTHRLVRPTAIGLGHTHCDFQFVPIGEIGER